MKSVTTGRFYPSGLRGWLPLLLESLMVKRLGAIPGIARIQLADLRLAWLMTRLLQHVYMGRRVALTVVQREMVATVVNGLIGGAP
ncbi:MAG: hypothetical protein AUG06_11910 [Actinobacteria bacterium 13_1_20CM_2_65_11]|nr:MAG: hypothetical protein AUH40_07120 [Chloroflexi bacterium 13_1_40CM_65_17]OLC66836.1 MAG: hypothetical protein AUH69_05975 [Actinobacteria bacterium 13_1_40CM_4_65_12]OLD23774.1 MAG: hypothetical protein AUJ02_09660 [Chloroflexi bacterium 13_1_40CM_3_65_12]OLD48715.1 MAG: hypothetical protein AUI42_11405 [Actinobacteria bacterium 13_1_40CM_2_65_8]OLE78089.1 MAG: hypothetical protein AUG06_11910 [Actinobacteria bacterium 13_1_20CM_2_65_11]